MVLLLFLAAELRLTHNCCLSDLVDLQKPRVVGLFHMRNKCLSNSFVWAGLQKNVMSSVSGHKSGFKSKLDDNSDCCVNHEQIMIQNKYFKISVALTPFIML